MAYSEFLADRIRTRLHNKGVIREVKMMGGLLFMVNDKMCISVNFDNKKQQDRLMVRVGKLNYEALLNKHGSRKMDFTGRPMKGFLYIDPIGFDAEKDLDFWVEKALEFNALL